MTTTAQLSRRIVLTQRWDVPQSALSPNEELVISHVTQTRCKQLGESPFCHGCSETPCCPYSPSVRTSQKSFTRCSWGPSLQPPTLSRSLSLSPSSSLSHPPSSFCSPAPRSFSIPTEERGLLCPDEGEKKNPKCRFYFREKESAHDGRLSM